MCSLAQNKMEINEAFNKYEWDQFILFSSSIVYIVMKFSFFVFTLDALKLI